MKFSIKARRRRKFLRFLANINQYWYKIQQKSILLQSLSIRYWLDSIETSIIPKIRDKSKLSAKKSEIFQLCFSKNCHFSPFLGHFIFTFFQKFAKIAFGIQLVFIGIRHADSGHQGYYLGAFTPPPLEVSFNKKMRNYSPIFVLMSSLRALIELRRR